jgi:hypothetical protein
MNASTRARILAVVGLAAVALFGAAGCKDDPAKLCECPNGTIHAAGEACCDGVDCTCKEVKYYNVTLAGKTISIEDRSGEKVTQKELDLIQGTITYFANDAESNDLTKVKKHLSKIIISGDSGRNGGIIHLDFDSLVADANNNVIKLINQIIAIIDDSSLTFNNFNSNIHLANGKNLNIGRAIALGRQFSNASAGVPAPFFAGNGSSKRKSLQAPICPALAGAVRTFFRFPA